MVSVSVEFRRNPRFPALTTLITIIPSKVPFFLSSAFSSLSLFLSCKSSFYRFCKILTGRFVLLVSLFNLSIEVGFKNTCLCSSHPLFKANQKSFKQVKLDLKVLKSLSSDSSGWASLKEIRRRRRRRDSKFLAESWKTYTCSYKSALSARRRNRLDESLATMSDSGIARIIGRWKNSTEIENRTKVS